MSDQKKIFGTVKEASHVGNTSKGWARWVVTYEDGEAYKVLIPDDCTYEPTVGETCGFFAGRFNSWIIDRDTIPEDASAPANGTAAAPAKTTSRRKTTVSRDDYWKLKDERDWQKYNHDVDVKEPQLAWQGYFNNIASICAAGVSTGKLGVEDAIDLAIQTTDELFANRHNAEDEATEEIPADES